MRQVGVLCAAALVALEENVSKLVDDHKNAKTLAGNFTPVASSNFFQTVHVSETYITGLFSVGINKIKGLKVDLDSVETNIVSITVTKSQMNLFIDMIEHTMRNYVYGWTTVESCT